MEWRREMIGIANDDEFESELARLSDKELRVELINIKRGRDKLEVPDSLRKVIADDVLEGNRKSGLELARAFDISSSSVSAYAHGSTSTASYNEPNPELSNHVNQTRERIATKARSRLLSALNSITKEKLEATKPGEAADVAKDMSVILRNIEPEKDNRTIGPNYIFMVPRQKKESDYEVLVVNE